jgi:hypothetical protein
MAINDYKSMATYEKSIVKLIDFIVGRPEHDEIRLSCGHGESNLAWSPALHTLLSLVQSINRRRAHGRTVTGKIDGTLYESRDYRFGAVC